MAKSVAVLSSAHDVSDARTHRWTRALLNAGCEVTLYLKGDPATGPRGARCVGPIQRSGVLARLWADITLPWQANEDIWIVLDPDLPFTCLPVAWLRRRSLVIDVHEDYEKVARDRSWATGWKQPVVRMGTRLATALAARADLTTVADDHVPPTSARRRVVVPNRPAIENLPKPSTHDEELRAVYVGDIRTSRGSTAMVQAIAASDDWHLDLIGPITDLHRAELEQSISSEATQRITFHGRQPPGRTWEIVEGAQVGLAMLEDTPAYRDSLPTKVVEYHAAGLALIVSPLPRMSQLIDASKGGAVAASVEEVSVALNAWSQNRAVLAEHGQASRAWAENTLSGEDPFDEAAAVIKML